MRATPAGEARVSDSSKLDKLTHSRSEQQTNDPAHANEPVGRGVRERVGYQAVLAERTRAVEGVRYRATGGASGIPPAGHIAAERREIIGAAAARILRKQSGSASGAQVPSTSGGPLPADVRTKMEPKLGADLSSVKIHTGSESAKAATDFGARAFTVGNDVHFNAGQFAPGTKEGDRLLAHELTHVVQGQRSGVQRKADADDANRGAFEDGTDAKGDHADVSKPGEPAEEEADKVGHDVANALHDEKNAATATKDDASTGAAKADEREKPAEISAKLDGVGRKVFLAPSTGTGSPGPSSSSGSSPSAATPQPFDVAAAKRAIDGKATDCTDLSAPLANDWVGKTQADIDTTFTDVNVVKHKVIEKFVSTGVPRVQTQTVGRPDAIAVQKFQDIDSEAHLDPAHGNIKDLFYNDLVGEMKKSDFTDRTRTFWAMQKAAGYKYNCKGKKIPPDRISPLSARNHSVERLYDNANAFNPGQIDAAIEAPMRADGVPQPEIDKAKANPEVRKKAYRHMLKSGADPLSTIDKSKPISPHGAWYAPGEIRPNTSAPPNAEFARMMTLGALQPEWYPTGTVVLNIDRRLSGAVRNIFKPTAFDGLMSALWCARNMGVDDYGVTGGGVGEFLEANVPFSDVTSATPIIPTDDFLADIQRVITEVKAKLGKEGSPTEEVLRGNGRNTRILNTTGNGTGGVKDMYGQIIDRSTQEQNSPSAAPRAPGAVQETSTAMPGAPAVAARGPFDTTNGPRA
jgi:hypothetical protein